MVFLVMLLFIYGIAESDAIYVIISVIMLLGTTIFGCVFARTFDQCENAQ